MKGQIKYESFLMFYYTGQETISVLPGGFTGNNFDYSEKTTELKLM